MTADTVRLQEHTCNYCCLVKRKRIDGKWIYLYRPSINDMRFMSYLACVADKHYWRETT